MNLPFINKNPIIFSLNCYMKIQHVYFNIIFKTERH